MKSTGERLIPREFDCKEDYIQFLRHKFAYIYVRDLLAATDRVIEIGFGEGYGTSILAEKCADVVGVDVEEKAVAHADTRYGGPNCSFRCYDGRHIPFPDGAYDAAISFQVIEHIEDDDRFVSEIARVIKTGGKAYLTTPNKTYRLKPGRKPWNRYHIREYYPDELAALLSRHFENVDILGISGNDTIQRIEYNRVKTGPLLDIAARLNLRKILPERIDYLAATLISRIKGRRTRNLSQKDFAKQFGLGDFHVHDVDVDKSLDLLAVCRK